MRTNFDCTLGIPSNGFTPGTLTLDTSEVQLHVGACKVNQQSIQLYNVNIYIYHC